MSQINRIQEELRQIEGGRFQTLANQYLYRKYSLSNCVEYGSQSGTDKTTRGIPDMYSVENGRYFFAAYTASTSDIRRKLLDDAHDCLNESKTGINPQFIDRIILCHTTPRLSPSITAEVSAVDPRIKIIGPETIASDLDGKYPALAHSILGVPLGKGSFVSPDRFIAHNARGRFTTNLSKPLMHRDSELSNIIQTINQNKAVVIQGQSGSGKTKIALDACLSFSKEHRWDLLILDSRYSTNLDEDIELVLSGSENIIILIDGANDNLSLEHLLGICSENDKLKIIFTCRKMHRSKLTGKIGSYLKYEEIELEPLSAKDIDTILEDEYKIKNRALRERVAVIAKGNLRLAIMAASSIVDGNFEAIREPYDLLKVYMDSALAGFSSRENHLIEILAIYDYCDLVKGDPCYDNLLSSGYNDAEIRDLVLKLDKQEIVTTLTSENVLAMRMEEQNLRDFLICRHFAKERRSSFADFILQTSAISRPLYLKAAKSMAEVCGSESVNEYIRKECERAWSSIRDRDVQIADQFILAFCQFIPVQALSFASSRIEKSAGADKSEEILDGSSTSGGSMPLQICVSLMDSDGYSQTSLELFVKCIEKGSEQASQYKWACGPNGAFSRIPNRAAFDIENKKLDALVSRYRETHSHNVAACLIILTDTYLSSKAECIRQNGTSHSISISALAYNFTPELAELHVHCFRALSALVGTALDERVKSTFRRYFSFFGKEPEAKRAKDMYSVLSKIENLFPIFINDDSTSDLSCSLSINQIYKTCAQKPPLNLDEFSQSTFDALALENSKSFTEKEPQITPKDLSLDRLTEALTRLTGDYDASGKDWGLSQAIGDALLEISKRVPDDALGIITHFFSSSPSPVPVPYEALDFLAAAIDRKTLRNGFGKTISMDDYPALFDYLDLLAVKNSPDEQELAEILARLDDGRLHLRLEDLEKAELEHPGYILDYATKLSECIHETDEVWRFFGICKDEGQASSLGAYFKSNPLPAIKLYFLAIKGFPHFDYNLALLRRLLHIEAEASTIDHCLNYASSLDFDQRYELLQRISSFWIDKDEQAWNLLKAFIDKALSDPLGRFDLAALFPIHDTAALSDDAFWSRLKRLITENITDAERLAEISWALSDCNDETRARAILLILTLDKDGISINHLKLRRSAMSGSPERGFIPAKQKEIKVIDTVLNRLPADISYLGHREWLEDVKANIEADIANEKWELFHGKQ